MEPFRQGQKGSSAMPHKRNPILSERIAGLARLLRGYAQAGFEDQPLWHERDISHSSAERVALPDATILLDYMLVRADGPGRRARGPPRADAREHRARPRPPRLVAGAAGARRARRAVARGRLRHRPAQRAAGRRTSACPLQRLLVDRPGRGAEAAAGRARRLLRRRDAAAPRAGGHRPARRAWRPSVRLAEAFVRAGKVRDLYRVGDDRLLLVASDRLSAFDVVLPTPIPDKGRVLTGLSRFWFARTGSIVPNHLLSTDPADVPSDITDGDPDVARDAPRPDDARAPGRGAADRDASCAATCRARAGRTTCATGAVCGIPLPARPPRERPAAGADLHAGHEGADGRARREHPVRERRDADRGRARGPGPRDVASRSTRTAPTRASGPGSSSPTRSSSSGCCPRASCS